MSHTSTGTHQTDPSLYQLTRFVAGTPVPLDAEIPGASAIPTGLSASEYLRRYYASRSAGLASRSMWKGTVVKADSSGQQEAFSIGPDGFVWSYGLDPVAGCTGMLTSTGLLASTFALADLGQGRTLVVAADGTRLHYVTETDDAQQRWSSPTVVEFAGSQTAVAIERILTHQRHDHLFIGVTTRHLDAIGQDRFQFWDSVWGPDGLQFCHAPVALDASNHHWLDQLLNSPRSLD
jgi:hypothetical protein